MAKMAVQDSVYSSPSYSGDNRSFCDPKHLRSTSGRKGFLDNLSGTAQMTRLHYIPYYSTLIMAFALPILLEGLFMFTEERALAKAESEIIMRLPISTLIELPVRAGKI